ncbi:DUF6992 family protein [Hymenobacter nivis]|uniref:Uncharacterized protein n=1 Tax=Hymenobacter nivis TaxID=1850093 RepID=A0A2Z3GST8_9BACT|nr:hypothetical protein [Hymenobacter nivis]AWM34486.1 hypothetical protein DDQ68_17865 [Hymenobacter nivis]
MPVLDPNALYATRELIVGRGLAVLAAWVIINLVGSGYAVGRADRRLEPYYFHLMNVAWALVNAGLAAWGIVMLRRLPPAGWSLAAEAGAHHHDENLFLINTGLDVLYVVVALWLRRRATEPGAGHPARLAGFGHSVLLQGGFLFVFDLAMTALLHLAGAPLRAAGL